MKDDAVIFAKSAPVTPHGSSPLPYPDQISTPPHGSSPLPYPDQTSPAPQGFHVQMPYPDQISAAPQESHVQMPFIPDDNDDLISRSSHTVPAPHPKSPTSTQSFLKTWNEDLDEMDHKLANGQAETSDRAAPNQFASGQPNLIQPTPVRPVLFRPGPFQPAPAKPPKLEMFPEIV